MASPQYSVQKLGDLAAPEDGAIVIGPFGSSMKSDLYTPAGVPLLRGVNLGGAPGFQEPFVYVSEDTADRFARCAVKAGDLVFPHRGSIGEVGLAVRQAPDKWLLSTSMMKFRPDVQRLDPLYAFHFFRSSLGRYELLKNASQVGTPGISQPLASLRDCEIPTPPLAKQRLIASILGALDDKIEQNRRTAQTLERLARAIFRAWFVDFEPVRAKASGATSFPSMSPTVFDSLLTSLGPSKRGPVPVGWETRPIASIATFLNGLALQKYPPKGDSTDLPVIKIAQLRLGTASGADLANAKIPAEYVIKNRDLLFSWSGTLEVEFWFGGQGALNQHLFKVSSQHYPDWFVLLSLKEHLPWFRMIAASKATTMGHIKREHLLGVHAVIAPPEIMQEADALIAPLYNLRAHLLLESQRLANLRDLLLPRLLSGQVRVATAGNLHG